MAGRAAFYAGLRHRGSGRGKRSAALGMGGAAAFAVPPLLGGECAPGPTPARHAGLGVWQHDAVWFSSSRASRKARNLAADPHCTVTTDNPLEPVVLDGIAWLLDDLDEIRTFVDVVNTKYDTDYGMAFFTGEANCVLRVVPESVFGLDTVDFTGTPTRWTPVR